jgi:hypothetical protein
LNGVSRIRRRKRALAILLFAAHLSAVPGAAQSVSPSPCNPLKDKKVLALSGDGDEGPRTVTLENLQAMAAQVGFFLEPRNGGTLLTDEYLAGFDIIVFNYLSGTHSESVLTSASKAAFMRWLRLGRKGYLGYHSSGANEWAADEWREYQDSVTGMRYAVHAGGTPMGTITRNPDPAVRTHPIMQGLPAAYTTRDEWYEFNGDSRIFDSAWNGKVMYYLTSVDAPRAPGPPHHPAAWFREDPRGSRYFYSIFFQTRDAADSDFFKGLLLRALEYTAGDCPLPIPIPEAPEASPAIGYRAAGRALIVDGDGPHRLTLFSPEGKALSTLEGKHRATYRPEALAKPGLYLIRIETPAGTRVRKVMAF